MSSGAASPTSIGRTGRQYARAAGSSRIDITPTRQLANASVSLNPSPSANANGSIYSTWTIDMTKSLFGDDNVLITDEEYQRRVFNAARKGGTFTVCTVGTRVGEFDSTLVYPTFPQALAVFIHLYNQQRRPIMYCAASTSGVLLLPRKSYKDPESPTGWVSSNDATADAAQQLLDAWCRAKGVSNQPQAPMIDTMRTPRRRVRERLPRRRERL